MINREYYSFTTPEYRVFKNIELEKKWEMCRGVGNSFGFNHIED